MAAMERFINVENINFSDMPKRWTTNKRAKEYLPARSHRWTRYLCVHWRQHRQLYERQINPFKHMIWPATKWRRNKPDVCYPNMKENTKSNCHLVRPNAVNRFWRRKHQVSPNHSIIASLNLKLNCFVPLQLMDSTRRKREFSIVWNRIKLFKYDRDSTAKPFHRRYSPALAAKMPKKKRSMPLSPVSSKVYQKRFDIDKESLNVDVVNRIIFHSCCSS